MKVQLVVVQGKPEGKSIPLSGPSFKIGRGDGCHLRPNSDLVSREHAEFQVAGDDVIVQDLGSRNGTEVNGKKLAANAPLALKNGDLVKIGTLTFAVAIEGAPAAKAAAVAPRKPGSLDDVSGDDIDAWLVSDGSRPTPDRPSGVYGGDTMTIETFNGKAKSSPQVPVPPKAAASQPDPASAPTQAKAPAPAPAPSPEPEPEEVIEQYAEEPEAQEDDGIQDLAALQEAEAANETEEEEFVDESNPFYAAKKAKSAPAPAAAKAPSKDSSDAAGDILRKMMDRRRASKS